MLLQSTRIQIRPWLRQDDDLADEWPPYHDPFEAIWNLPRSFSFIEQWGLGFDAGATRRSWAVEDLECQLIGRVSLREIDERRSQARLGVTFAAPFVGRGLGTEALRLFLDYYFDNLGFQVMVLDVAAPNQRAVRCYERLGFRRIGSDWRSAGGAFDTLILNDATYAPLRRFFRSSPRGVQIEFFEMRLSKYEWKT